MDFKDLERRSEELICIIKQRNEINEELTNEIEVLLSEYSKYYCNYEITSPGQLISENQATLLIAYSKVYTVPIIISDGHRVIANASGLLLTLDTTFLVTNYHVYEEWKRLSNEKETIFQIGSLDVPIEELIISMNKSLDLITILLPNQYIERISGFSYKKYYSPQKWPFEVEIETVVIASGFPGKIREDGIGESTLFHGSIVEPITDITESKYIMPFNREHWIQTLGVKDPNDLIDFGGFSGGPVFTFIDGVVSLVGIIFEDGGGFFEGLRIIKSYAIHRDGAITTDWGY